MKADTPIGVIFDMDGVLVDSADAHLKSWRLLAKECGRTVTQEQFAESFGRQNRDIIPALFGPAFESRMQELADRKEELYRDLIQQRTPIIEGAVELVWDLHNAGARIAVGSSGPPANIEVVVASMGIGECLSGIVTGDDVAKGKPDPEVFLLAADRLGLAPARCVVIEDAPVGIEAARAAGVHAVAILLYHPAEAFDRADLLAERLCDLTVDRLVSLVDS